MAEINGDYSLLDHLNWKSSYNLLLVFKSLKEQHRGQKTLGEKPKHFSNTIYNKFITLIADNDRSHKHCQLTESIGYINEIVLQILIN